MTGAIGVFNYAESYRRAAKALQAGYKGWTHFSSPTRYLFFHSCELFLKSYLWNQLGEKQLKDIGHKLTKLHSVAREHDLPATPYADHVFDCLDFKYAMNERYLETGFFDEQLNMEALSYLSAEICVATHYCHLADFPNLSSHLNVKTLLSSEEFQLPEELGGPRSKESVAMQRLDAIFAADYEEE